MCLRLHMGEGMVMDVVHNSPREQPSVSAGWVVRLPDPVLSLKFVGIQRTSHLRRKRPIFNILHFSGDSVKDLAFSSI